LAGTWELPWAELRLGSSSLASGDAGSLLKERSLLNERYGGIWTLLGPRVTVHHAITYRRIEVRAFAATVEGLSEQEVRTPKEAVFGWFDDEERRLVPHSSLVEKVLDGSNW
jgi:hypothetical protein